MMLAQAQTQPPPSPAAATATAPAPAPTLVDSSQVQPTNTPIPAETAAPGTTGSPPVRPQPVSLRQASGYLFGNDFRAWLVVVGALSITCMILFGLPIYGVWFLLISSTWAAQVLRNVYQRTRRVVRHDTVILSSIFRLFTPLCE